MRQTIWKYCLVCRIFFCLVWLNRFCTNQTEVKRRKMQYFCSLRKLRLPCLYRVWFCGRFKSSFISETKWGDTQWRRHWVSMHWAPDSLRVCVSRWHGHRTKDLQDLSFVAPKIHAMAFVLWGRVGWWWRCWLIHHWLTIDSLTKSTYYHSILIPHSHWLQTLLLHWNVIPFSFFFFASLPFIVNDSVSLSENTFRKGILFGFFFCFVVGHISINTGKQVEILL